MLQLPQSNERLVIFEARFPPESLQAPPLPSGLALEQAVISSAPLHSGGLLQGSSASAITSHWLQKTTRWHAIPSQRSTSTGTRNAGLAYSRHDNRHHFTGAALRTPVWAEVTELRAGISLTRVPRHSRAPPFCSAEPPKEISLRLPVGPPE